MISKPKMLREFPCLTTEIDADSAETLRNIGNSVREQIPTGIAWLAAVIDEKSTLLCVVSDDLIERGIKAGEMVNEIASASRWTRRR